LIYFLIIFIYSLLLSNICSSPNIIGICIGHIELAIHKPLDSSYLCWNCRGLGNLWTVREFHHLVKTKHPHILFLMETRMKNCSLQKLRVRFGFQGLFTVDPVGLSGGLAFFWRDSEEVEIQNYSRRHINASICLENSATPWSFTGFYGHPDRSMREESWKLLSHIGSLQLEAWLCMGDFNEIVDQTEKVGGRLRATKPNE
jgi:hypothetical protein